MPLNLNLDSHFAQNPTNIDISRSKFNRPYDFKGTMNLGQLIPFYVDSDVLPGDTFSMDSAKLIRTQPLVAPIMDDLVADVFWFAVPYRLVWSHLKEFFGENTQGPWTEEIEYTIPQIESPEGGWNNGTIADYMGVPTKVDWTGDDSISALPFRAYALVVNEFFRSEVVSDPLNIPIGDITQTGSNGTDYVNDIANGGVPFTVCKNFDFFTSGLPSPQKGEAVAINLAGLSGTIPVAGNGKALGLTDGTLLKTLGNSTTRNLNMSTSDLGTAVGASVSNGGSSSFLATGIPTLTQLGDSPENSGLIGDLSSVSGETLITINELRQAFQVQKYFEKLGRSGSRYREYIKGMFGVTSPDARMQVPEYLGGSRFMININPVYQTSETGNTAQGNAAAYSVTTDVHHDFSKSFTEHSIVLGLLCVRHKATYQQGLERMWSRKTVLDFYNPLFANLGEMPIYNKQIYGQGASAVNPDTNELYDNEVFAYNEAWAEYRYKNSLVTGEMRSNHQTSLDVWHLADYYQSMPSLSDEWMREDPSVLDRCLAVSSQVSNQFLVNIHCDCDCVRPMPVYSIPGLIDHH